MENRIMLLWAKSNIERSFWVDTIKEMITESYPNRQENIQEHIETLFMYDKTLNAQLADKLKRHYQEKKFQEEKDYDTVQLMSD